VRGPHAGIGALQREAPGRCLAEQRRSRTRSSAATPAGRK
jgi:hypothetical protein